MKEYQTVVLLLYPRLEQVAEDIAQVVAAQAAASVSGRECAEKCVERLIRYTETRRRFLDLAARMEEVLGALSREERYLLEYKYFRRRKVLAEEYADLCLHCSPRTYYRKQSRLAVRLNALFLRAGVTESWFRRELEPLPYIAAALRSLRARPGALVDKRARRELCLRGK